jgi:hypothetical protein
MVSQTPSITPVMVLKTKDRDPQRGSNPTC